MSGLEKVYSTPTLLKLPPELTCISVAVQPESTLTLQPSHIPLHPLTNIPPPQFTAKQLNRQAAKAGKDETAEKNKLKKVPHPPTPPSPYPLTPSRQSNKTTPT